MPKKMVFKIKTNGFYTLLRVGQLSTSKLPIFLTTVTDIPEHVPAAKVQGLLNTMVLLPFDAQHRKVAFSQLSSGGILRDTENVGFI